MMTTGRVPHDDHWQADFLVPFGILDVLGSHLWLYYLASLENRRNQRLYRGLSSRLVAATPLGQKPSFILAKVLLKESVFSDRRVGDLRG
jgi:hypothetical protein